MRPIILIMEIETKKGIRKKLISKNKINEYKNLNF